MVTDVGFGVMLSFFYVVIGSFPKSRRSENMQDIRETPMF